ncbi:Smr/MutS family protein [Compostibacter hankyongensis]|uniref:Smr domain-containing protein n=1 Tax=Compostibacter hankyongensis TaxID=1007089 RepID=A0ABP8FMB8_9BACT
MKFEVGDTVLLLHSQEEGRVVEILGRDMVMVDVGGVTFPAYIDQLDFPYFKRFTEKKRAPPRPLPGEQLPREKPAPQTRPETGVWLSFLPVYHHDAEEVQVQKLKIYLVNETADAYQLHYRMYLADSCEMEMENQVAPFAHFYLSDLLFEDLNDRPRLELRFSLQPAAAGRTPFLDKVVKLKPRQVMERLSRLQQQQEATFRQLLFEKYPATDTEAGWDIAYTPSPDTWIHRSNGGRPSPAAEPLYEVDLHIEKLVDNPRGMSNFEMLTTQLHEFNRYLELAIAHHQASLIVIHGVGKGKLRDEIHEILHHVPEVSSFVNQYHPRYGYGATEIFFKYA